jgi:hypothetical protein
MKRRRRRKFDELAFLWFASRRGFKENRSSRVRMPFLKGGTPRLPGSLRSGLPYYFPGGTSPPPKTSRSSLRSSLRMTLSPKEGLIFQFLGLFLSSFWLVLEDEGTRRPARSELRGSGGWPSRKMTLRRPTLVQLHISNIPKFITSKFKSAFPSYDLPSGGWPPRLPWLVSLGSSYDR